MLVTVMEAHKALGISWDTAPLGLAGVLAGLVVVVTVVTSAIGGFVVVAQMILQDKVCIRV